MVMMGALLFLALTVSPTLIFLGVGATNSFGGSYLSVSPSTVTASRCCTAFSTFPISSSLRCSSSAIKRRNIMLDPNLHRSNINNGDSKIRTTLSLLPRTANNEGMNHDEILSAPIFSARANIRWPEEKYITKTVLTSTMMSVTDNDKLDTTTAIDDSEKENDSLSFSDTNSLNVALYELSKSGKPGSAQKAQSILDAAELEYQKYREQNKNEKDSPSGDGDDSNDDKVGPIPDIRSYSYVIAAWSREGTLNGAQNAQNLLDKVIEMSDKEGGNIDKKKQKKKGKKNKNQRRMKPNTVSYNLVINAWAKSGDKDAAERAERLLSQMQKHYSDGTNPHCQPNSTTYNAVMNAWSKSALVRRADNSGDTYDDETQNTLIANGAGENAERLLSDMWNQYESTSDPNLRPTQFSYATAISAWARTAAQVSGNASRKCAERAEALLEEMEEVAQKHGYKDLHPTTYCINAVLNAWAKSRTKKRVLGARRAQEILERMERLYDFGYGREEVKPNAVSFNTVIDAWAKSGERGSERQAESILRRMDELSSHPDTKGLYEDCRPDTISYNAVVHAWGRSREQAAARRAEAILRHMERRYEEDIKAGVESSNVVTPDVTTYTSVLNAWARSREENAASRAESILKRMEEASSSAAEEKNYKSRNLAARPTILSYNTVLNAWAKSSHPEAADRALSIFKKIEESNDGVHPDVYTYTSVIDALAKRASEKSANKAEQILERMEALYDKTGDDKVRPNVRTYTSVIHALSRGKCDPQRAEVILDRMEQLSMDNRSLLPDVVSFNSVINAWGWSDKPQKAQKAWDIYLRMKESFESGANSDAKPDLITCNSILNACAFTKGKRAENGDAGDIGDNSSDGNAQERARALEIAVQTLEEFQSVSPKFGRPNHITYGNMLMAITNLMTPAQSLPPKNEDANDENKELEGANTGNRNCLRTDLAISTFWQCCRDGQVSPFVIAQLRNVVPEETFCELLGEAAVPCTSKEYGDNTTGRKLNNASEKEHKYCCDMKKLPAEWTTFLTGKKTRPSRRRYSEQVSKR